MAPPAVNSGFGDRVCLVPVFGLHASNWLPAIGYGRSDSAVGWDDTWTGGGHPNTNGDALDGKWVQVNSNDGWWDTCRSHELQTSEFFEKLPLSGTEHKKEKVCDYYTYYSFLLAHLLHQRPDFLHDQHHVINANIVNQVEEEIHCLFLSTLINETRNQGATIMHMLPESTIPSTLSHESVFPEMR